MSKTIIVSVGGSLIVPNDIDSVFLKNLKKFVDTHVKKGFKFAIICGGGKTSRNYQNAASKISKVTSEDLDWIGISSTFLNAHLMRTILKEHASAQILKDPNKAKLSKKVLVGAGWKPGFSSDLDAVLIAKKLKAKQIVNLSNIDYVYTKDPRKFKNAKPIKELTWKNFRNIIPKSWDPGLSSPFDPVASKMAQNAKIEVAIINGKNLKEFANYLSNKNFTGTKIAG